MYPIFRPLLQKGGAGRSLSRKESAEALIPLVERHGRLIAAYDRAIRTLGDREVAQEVERLTNRLRTELAKLKETVFSLAGTPPNGVGLRDETIDLGDTDRAIIENLHRLEHANVDALKELLNYPHHQIRTIAILKNNVMGSQDRLDVLGPLTERASTDSRAIAAPVDPITEKPADLEHTVETADVAEQPVAQREERADDGDDGGTPAHPKGRS